METSYLFFREQLNLSEEGLGDKIIYIFQPHQGEKQDSNQLICLVINIDFQSQQWKIGFWFLQTTGLIILWTSSQQENKFKWSKQSLFSMFFSIAVAICF